MSNANHGKKIIGKKLPSFTNRFLYIWQGKYHANLEVSGMLSPMTFSNFGLNNIIFRKHHESSRSSNDLSMRLSAVCVECDG